MKSASSPRRRARCTDARQRRMGFARAALRQTAAPAAGPSPRHRSVCPASSPCRRSCRAWRCSRHSRARRRPPGKQGRWLWRSGPAVLFFPDNFPHDAPSSTAARMSAPVLWMCMNSSSGSVERWPCRSTRGRSAGRRPCRASRRRAPAASPCRAACADHRPAGAPRAAGRQAIAAHRRPAARSPRRTRTCTVGLPRRSTSSSMHGMSSCTSE